MSEYLSICYIQVAEAFRKEACNKLQQPYNRMSMPESGFLFDINRVRVFSPLLSMRVQRSTISKVNVRSFFFGAGYACLAWRSVGVWLTIYWMCYFLMIPFVVLSIFREMPETKINLSTWWTLIRIHSSKIAVLCFSGGRISGRNCNMVRLEQIVHISISFGNPYFKPLRLHS